VRVFYATPGTAHQTRLPESRVWHNNLLLPLRDLGHDVVVFDYDYTDANEHLNPDIAADRRFIATHRQGFGAALLHQLRAAHAEKPVDLFFSYFYSSYVHPDAIREIRDMGIVTVNWYCNASYQFHLIEELAPAYDYCLVPEKFRLHDYRRIGATPIYCQEAANPHIYKPKPLPLDYDVTFVGQRYGTRPWLLRGLLDGGIDVRAWGPHWQEPDSRSWLTRGYDRLRELAGNEQAARWNTPFPVDRCGPPLSDDELIAMYSRSRISLGFTQVASPDQIKQVRLRDFEATMSGAFYLVEHFDELADFFEPDKEIVFFHDRDDLIDKARFYLVNDTARERIREAGMRRARAEHTWHARFEMVFRKIGLT
jgi:spore maturation protein CgeB